MPPPSGSFHRSLNQKTDGISVYLGKAYSPLFDFLYGRTFFLAVQCGAIAALAMVFSKYLGVLYPWISEYNIFFELGNIKINFIQITATISIVLLTWVNLRDIEKGKKNHNIFTLPRILILLFFIIIGFAFSKGIQVTHWLDNPKNEIQWCYSEVAIALIIIILSFGCNNKIILSGAGVYYGMAYDGISFKNTALPNKGIPSVFLWVQSIWSTILCLSGTYNQLLYYIIFTAFIFNILTIISFFILHLQNPVYGSSYNIIRYLIAPVIYIAICLMTGVILLIY